MSDLTFVLSHEEWMRIQRRLPSVPAHGKVINSLQLIISFALNNPDLQLEVIRQKLSISKTAMKKYSDLLDLLRDSGTERAVPTDSAQLNSDLEPLVRKGLPIPLTKLAQKHGVSVSFVQDRMKEMMAAVAE